MRALSCLLTAALLTAIVSERSDAARRRVDNHEAVGFQLFASPQADPIALSPNGTHLYVANTTSNTVDVIDTGSQTVVATVPVGLEPVSVAVRPDGLEVWVSNHVSDTVSVIDTDPSSSALHSVVETIQDLDGDGVTRFDEPVGIAFASSTKAYVALSSRNDVAVVDVPSYSVTSRLHVTAQEPRALAVRDGLLYVAAFESSNKTEISACGTLLPGTSPGDQCTIGLVELAEFVTNPNLPGIVKNIVVDPEVPDRDLFVYDTSDDSLVTALEGVGTLLYGVAVGPGGQVYVTQADARNQVNGDHGLNLVDLDNRMFDNRITHTTCGTGGCTAPGFIELDPALPAQPSLGPGGNALATPYGIQVSGDGGTLVATAAGTSRLFTVATATQTVLGILDLGGGASFGAQIPRGVALRSAPSGAPQTAYVLNTLENTVSVVDVGTPASPVEVAEIPVGSDPTLEPVRRGRIAFNSAFASTFETFSCASCHPDGNTDQLLWRIGGPCSLPGCDGNDEARSTMPVRGLANTLPLHWDGTLGDPFGGPNGAIGSGSSAPPTCTDDASCFRDLVDASLSGVMCDVSSGCGSGGELGASERDDMATFLASVVYPPARGRRMDESISQPGDGVTLEGLPVSALDGFKDFFTDQGGNAGGDPSTCADSTAGCHELPLGVSTNSSTLQAFDAPTMRGLNDRWLQFSMGVTNAEEILFIGNQGLDLRPFVNLTAAPLEAPLQYSASEGVEEASTFGTAFIAFEEFYGVRPPDMVQMLEEASTGLPGAAGRQVTLNDRTTTGPALAATEALMSELEAADAAGLVNLRASGLWDAGGVTFFEILLSYRAELGEYRNHNDSRAFTHADLVSGAQDGSLLVTLTATLRSGYGDANHPQPLLAPESAGSGPTGDPDLHRIGSGGNPAAFDVSGVDVRDDAVILVDGQVVSGTLGCVGGSFGPICSSGVVSVDLDTRPSPDGLHLLQVRNGAGPLSNELPFCVGSASGCQ